MIVATRKKFIVHKLNIKKKHQTFEVLLPNNVKRVTGVYITAHVHPNLERIGTISFQSQTESDIFLCTDVCGVGSIISDDTQFKVYQGDFDIDLPYVSGNIPGKIPLWVEGDTGLINGFFKASHTAFPYTIHLIFEYELVEKIVTENERIIYS